jgi:hypothetical protein
VDLMGRRLVDTAITLIVGHFFVSQAAANERKKKVLHRYLERDVPLMYAGCAVVLSGDDTAFSQYEEIAGPVPSLA